MKKSIQLKVNNGYSTKFIVLFFVVIFSISGNAQFISSVFNFDFDYSVNTINYFPNGNLGFDTKLNPYNPQLINSRSEIYVQVGLFSNLKQIVSEDGVTKFNGKTKILPNCIFQYQHSFYAIQISYINNLISSYENLGGDFSYNFNQLDIKNVNIQTTNTAFQISSVFKTSKNITIGIGILTNKTDMKFDLMNQGNIRFYQNLFDNIQFSLAMNYAFSNQLKSYIVLRSADSQEKSQVENESDLRYFSKPYFYYNGIFGLGIRYSIFNCLGISLETYHDFNSYTKDQVNPYYAFSKKDENIFNSRIITGINYQPLNSLQIGFLFSKYVEYKNPFFTSYERDTRTTPYSINFGALYKYKCLSFNLSYQYTGLEIGEPGSSLTKKYTGQNLGFTVGFEM